MIVSIFNAVSEFRVLKLYLAADEGNVGNELLGRINRERTIRPRQALIVIGARMFANEYLEGGVLGIAKRKPGEAVTGLDLTNFYFANLRLVVSRV